MTHDFDIKLANSLVVREKFDLSALRRILWPSCVSVEKTDVEMDKSGVDYIATLRRGATLLIDAKSREKGASRYWHGEPELALEKWSVCPEGTYEGKVGWSLNESTNVDLILYTFDASDANCFYLLPFQPLRMAFRRNIRPWEEKYKVKKQYSTRWQSEAIFVPASVVLSAIHREMVFAPAVPVPPPPPPCPRRCA